MQMIGSMLDFVAQLPLLKSVNRWAGGALGFMEVYLLLFVLLYVSALVPVSAIQQPLHDSLIASLIVKHTPILSDFVKHMLVQYMA